MRILRLLAAMLAIATGIILLSANNAFAKEALTEQSFKTSEGAAINYLLYEPQNPSKNMPLIIYLHGGSGKGDNLSLIKQNGLCKWINEGEIKASCYVVFPQLPSKYSGWIEYDSELLELADSLCGKYNLDKNKISLTGHSMGGTGCYELAAKHPEKFYRVAPASGSVKINPQSLNSLAKVELWAFVGSADKIVDPSSSQRLVGLLKQRGANAQITAFVSATHFDVPELLYKNTKILDWLAGI